MTAPNIMALPTPLPESPLGAERVLRFRQSRFNPINGLKPETLAALLDGFEAGDLRQISLLFEAIAERDDTLKTVIPKRKKAVARRPWEILTSDDSPEALTQKQLLEDFYNGLSVSNAIDQNERGGLSLLVRQMMDSQAKRYAAHHIVWQPGKGSLTAAFHFVPLWFFENRTGRLRFLPQDYAYEGTALDEMNWLVTCGDGLMVACSIAYIFKRLPLQDWLNFSEKFGVPGIHGETSAAKGSSEWNDFTAALAAFAGDWVTATTTGAKINLIEAKGGTNLPFQPLVERMDRAMMSLWRGGDLSTQSKGDAVGSNAQVEEGDILLEDDCALISETLNEQIDRRVIAYTRGATARVLAYIKILPPSNQDTKAEIETDQFLLEAGVALAEEDLRERYGRPAPDAEETIVAKSQAQGAEEPKAQGPRPKVEEPAANDLGPDPQLVGQFMARSRDLFGTATETDLTILREALETLLSGDDATVLDRATVLYGQLTALAPQIIESLGNAQALYRVLSTAAATGLATAENGDLPGHPFRGNQYTGSDQGEEFGGGEAPDTDPREQVGKTGDWKSLHLPDVRQMTPDAGEPEMTPSEARRKLSTPYGVDTPFKEVAIFGPDVLRHWESKSKTPADVDNRLRFLAQAEASIRHPHEVWENPQTGTRTYIQVARGADKARVVHAWEFKDGQVESYIATSDLRRKGNQHRTGKLVHVR